MPDSNDDISRLDALIKADDEQQEAVLSCQWDAERLEERLAHAVGRNPVAVATFIGKPIDISEPDLSSAVKIFSKKRIEACNKR